MSKITWFWLSLCPENHHQDPWRTPHIRLKDSDRRPFFFSFRLDIGVGNFNLLSEFVSIAKLENGRINLRIANL